MQKHVRFWWLAAAALVVPAASLAQDPRPRIREIAVLPGVRIEEAVTMPNGRIVLIATGDSILAYDLQTRRSTLVTRGWGDQLRITRQGDRLAYTGLDENDNEIIMSIPTDPRTGLAAGPAQRVSVSHGDEPSFSPDGKLLAFGVAGAAKTQELAVVAVTGGPERILARYGNARIGETYWSADGTAVFAQVSRDPARQHWTLERVPLTGGAGERTVSYTGYAEGSIEGRIVFLRPGHLARARREGLFEYQTATGRTGAFMVPRQSIPTGNLSTAPTLAVQRTRQEWAHIVSLTDGKVRELRPGSAHSRGPAWSPDGRQIALHDSTEGGVYGITVMNPDGSRSRHYPVSAFPSYMRWAPNGQSVAYSLEPRLGGPAEIGVLDLASGETRIVSSTAVATALDYRWRPDSKSLMVFKWIPRSGGGPLVKQLFEAPLSGSERLLRDLSVEFPSMINGGPFSAALVGLGNAANTEHYLVSTTGNSVVKLPRGGNWIREPGMSADGKWLAAVVRDPDGRITSMDLVSTAGDSVRTLRLPFEASPSTFRPPFTPDGKNLILFGTLPGETVSKIFSVPLDGTAPRVLATLPTASQVAGRLDLSPDGTAVVVTSVGPWSSRLYEIDVTPILQAVGMR